MNSFDVTNTLHKLIR